MKTKPNFTYKEFIQKISNVQINNKDKVNNKSPRALKSQNKNISVTNVNRSDKPFQKKNPNKQQSLIKIKSSKISPRKIQTKQNEVEQSIKNNGNLINLKNTTNKKLKLKNQVNTPSSLHNQSNFKHSKSIHQQLRENFYHNESSFIDQRHNQSCSTYFKNYNYENQEESLSNNNMNRGKSPSSLNSKLNSKKHSCTNIDGKLKVLAKGNLTDRNIQRVNTQYYEQTKRPQQRLNTLYEKSNQKQSRLSPSFYKLSADESSFLEYQYDKTHKDLFPQTSTSRTKKSTISLCSQKQDSKINQKSCEHVYNKFILKISETLFSITKIDDQNKLLDHKIKYIQFLQSLKQLKMIKSDYQPYSQTQGTDLVKQLWEQLIMGHNTNHFIIIVALILKITPLQYVKAQNSPQLQNYIYIQNKYQQFRFTRLQLDKSKVYSQKDSIQYYNFPFKPTISKTSQQILSQPKTQRKYKINTSLNHNQSLHSKRQNNSITTQFQNHNQSTTSRGTSPLGNKRSQILYKQAKKKSLQKRIDKSTIDYQFQKNKQQLTFKPKIILKRKKIKNQQINNEYTSPRFAIDQQKMINRLIRGRIQKQVKQLTIDKGMPYNEKMIQKLRRQKFEQIMKQQQQSRIKSCHNQSKIKLKSSQLNHNKSKDERSVQILKQTENNNYRCTTQVEQLQNIHDLSFQDYNENEKIEDQQQCMTKRIQTSPLKKSNLLDNLNQNQQVNQQQEHSLQDYFALDIYFEQNRSDKLLIRRDSSIQQVVAQAQRFVLKHHLPTQMGYKLKQQLMIAMKFHDIQKIQENAEEDQCSLIG